MSKADFNKIQKLLKTVTAYRISKATGIGDTTISRWVTGKTPNEDGKVYCNSETINIMDIYCYDGEDGHFYGVYGDAVGGQIDSRNVSDDVILKAIKLMLGLGEPVKRSELPTDSDFKGTFFFEE